MECMLVVDFIQNLRMCSKVERNATRLLLKDGGYYLIDPHPIEGFYQIRYWLSNALAYLLHNTQKTCLENLILHVKFDCHVIDYRTR